MKKANLLFILLFILLVNFGSKTLIYGLENLGTCRFLSNIITGFFAGLLFLILIKKRVVKSPEYLSIFLISQGVFFYFLLTNPRLSEKIHLSIFFLCGILLFLSLKKGNYSFPLYILAFTLITELTGHLFLNRYFIFLNILRYSIVFLSGYISGNFLFKSR